MVEQNISANIFYFADYFINFDKILVFIKDFGECKDNVICEIGKYNNKEECINIEYVLDNKKIDDSTVFKDKLKYIKISEIYKNISEGQNTQNEIEFKEYNFYFDNDNQDKTNNTDKRKKEEDSLKDDEKINILKDIKIFKKSDENKLNKIEKDSDNIIKEKYLELDINSQKLDNSNLDNLIDTSVRGNNQSKMKLIMIRIW